MSEPRAVAKKDSKKTGSGQEKVDWKGYVNYDMTQAQKKAARELLNKEPEVVANWLQKAVESGYTLKVNWSEYRKGISAGLFCVRADLPNAGYCLTQHSDSAELSIYKVLYVHFQILKGAWDGSGNPRELDAGWYD